MPTIGLSTGRAAAITAESTTMIPTDLLLSRTKRGMQFVIAVWIMKIGQSSKLEAKGKGG